MKLDFVKNTKRNVIASLTSNAVGTVLPFVRKTVFMWVLGSEYLGLNGLFYSILGMLMLSEMGFGTAIVCYMYKPIADDNRPLFCAYLRFYRTIYRFVGSFIFITGLCLLPFLRKLIHGSIPQDINLYVLYMMFLTNSVIGYFFFAYRGSILAAHHRNDIATYIGIVAGILEVVVACIVLWWTHNYYCYVIVLIARTVLNNITVFIATRVYFPDIVPSGKLPKEEIKRILSDVKAIFMHKIGAVVSGSFDTIVISSFLGLSAVAAFGNYSHIMGSVAGVVGAVCYSMMGGFGNKIYTESHEDTFTLLMKANRLLICIILWGAAMLLALYQPFMIVWTKKDPTLIQHFLTPFLMVVWFYEKQSRETLRMFKNAASLWQQDRWKAVLASLANLALNLLFINFLPSGYKLDGVILATIITDVVIQMPWESYAVFSSFFNKHQALHYWRIQGGYFILAIFLCTVTWVAATAIPMEGLAGLAVKGVVSLAISVGVLLAIFRDDAWCLLKRLVGSHGT